MAISARKKLALAGTGAAVLALGIAVPAVAFAQDPSPSSSASATDPGESDREQRHAERRDQMAEALAKELGISKDKVAAALDKVENQMRDSAAADRQAALKERLATAVSEGKLTQEQADAILKAAEAGVMGGGPGGIGGHGHGGGLGR